MCIKFPRLNFYVVACVDLWVFIFMEFLYARIQIQRHVIALQKLIICISCTCGDGKYRITGYFHQVQIFTNAALLALAEIFMIQKFMTLSSFT